MTSLRTKSFPISLLTLTLLCGSSIWAAPVAPDAGQTLRDLEKQPLDKTPKAAPTLRIENNEARKEGSTERVMVRAIYVTGSTAFAASELEAIVANLSGAERTLAELDDGAEHITTYYREHGYPVALAYLPAQDIKDGVVNIAVMEGRFDKRRINNQARLADGRANDYLNGIKGGDLIAAAPIDRALLLLNDTPGVGAARATLQPGASVGTSDLVIELMPSAPYSANIELDNYGNRYTGEYRLGGALYLNSPLKMGDLFSVRALTSNQNLAYGRLAWQVPVGGSGFRLGVAYSDTRYRLGKEFAALDAHGSATSASLFAVYPFIRSQISNLSGTLTWEDKKLNDRVDATTTITDKQVRLANIGLTGNHQDALGGAGNTTFDLSLVAGSFDIGSAAALAIDAASARSNGGYNRIGYGLNRLQRLTNTSLLYASFAGQVANNNLDSSEKFSLGGASAVRAYPQGEASGDEGWLANLELRHNFEKVQGVMFYDAGSVNINRNQFVAGAANTRNIAGAGIGANANLAGLQIKTYLAWRTVGEQPTSEPTTINRNPRLWLQASKLF